MLKAPKGIWGLIVDKLDWQIFPLQRRVMLPPQTENARSDA
jgi:branched-chain amino acid transport system permease protein